MNNFGVVELASAKTTHAPGWAYVPDTRPAPGSAALPSNRKRAARNHAGLSLSDASARQDAKIRKDLEVLDRDTHKDANIAIPPRTGGSRAQNKHTTNVRKILQSQKTFANHLDDYQALVALAETNPAAAAALNPANAQPKPAPPPTARNSPAPQPTPSTTTSKRSAAAAKRAAAAAAKEEKERKEREAREAEEAAEAAAAAEAERKSTAAPDDNNNNSSDNNCPPTAPPDVEMADASSLLPQAYPADGTILAAYAKPPPAPHAGDADPLLVSHVPAFPTDDELHALMTAPPLSYLEARARWGDDEQRYPARAFCEVCGHWGKVRCVKCGARACALDCLEAHREECVTRYGL
ncbi:hypothetical protein B0H67DRAFT_597433 [Lasiosphaeris hirsuta]|uniref:HIT-type domain-containing protein n=1 Tax=Lasiosphaeris hirsuta TaxID=260670 RepID=A0AA40BC74_9PEZI|nr:hypothetical protein B0H67DRAFT_597433 [Lasiosphaeris hirsuta]